LPRRSTAIIVWLCVAAVGTAAVALAFSSLQQDFAAYWVAGKSRWLGLDPYVNHCGSGVAPRLCDGVSIFRHSRFLYPPLAAELFRLVAIVPYRFAKLAFTAAAVGGWLLTARLMALRPGGRPAHGAAVIITGALFFPLYFHLERGQIDLLLLPLVLAAWLRRDRVLAAGGVVALVAVFKPALLGVLPVMVALGHRRWALSTIAASAVLFAASLAISGPHLVGTYVTGVLPRAAIYGEGGTEDMLLPAGRMPVTDEDGDTVDLDGRTYNITVPPFDGPASASLPRLLAPRAPTWVTTLLPYLLVIAGLAWVARRLPRRHEDDDPQHDDDIDDPVIDDAQLLLFAAATLACVVTSPTGWVMSFVWALPIAPLLWTGAGRARLSRRALGILGAVWIAAGVFPLINGWAAVAGLALVVGAAWAADIWADST
jgi:hypothetical protein